MKREPSSKALLSVQALFTGYGNKQILNDVTLKAMEGEIVALIGHNGAGKSTLLKASFGLLPPWGGIVSFDDRPINGLSTRDLLKAGLTYVPQGNRVFADLTVRENLEMGGVTLREKQQVDDAMERVLRLFAPLRSRLKQRAGTLSGGERQMVALAIAFMLSPRLILLDEPSLGLSPRLVAEAFDYLRRLNEEKGVTFVIVEQKVREVLHLCDSVYCLKLGRVTYAGPPDELEDGLEKLKKIFL